MIKKFIRFQLFSVLNKRNYAAFDRYQSPKIVTDIKSVPPAGYLILVLPLSGVVLSAVQYVIFGKVVEENRKHREKMKQTPVNLPKNLSDLKSMEFTPIKLLGEFDHENEFVIQPRTRYDEEYSKIRKEKGYFSKDEIGGLVITPFVLSGRNEKVLIARGWVPSDKIKKETREDSQVKGQLEIVAVTRNNEKRPTFVQKSDPEKNIYSFRDVEAMAWHHKTLPYYFEAVADSSLPDGPIGGQTKIFVSKEHYFKIVAGVLFTVGTGHVWFNKFVRRRIFV